MNIDMPWIILSWNGPADIDQVMVEQERDGMARVFNSQAAAHKWASKRIAFDWRAVEIG